MTPTALSTPRSARLRAISCSPWALSLIAHGALLLAAIALTTARGPAPPPASVGAMTLDAVPVRVERPPIVPETQARAPESPVPAPVQVHAAPSQELRAMPPVAPLSDALETPVTLGSVDWSPEPSDATPPVSLAQNDAPALFGARGDRAATRIVYVIDGSGAMVSALPNVLAELERSIDALAPDRWVQAVVFRDGRFEVVPGATGEARDAMLRADAAGKRGVSRWLGAQRAAGRSDPLPALERALAFRPDVVFLVSKGLGDPTLSGPAAATRREAVLRRLDTLNPADRAGRRHASIKVIQFFDTDPGGLLQEIGLRHGGADGYTFIRREDLLTP